MSLPLTKPYPRLWSLDSGIAMVVTDLHGDWDAYQRYRDRFVDLQAKGEVDWLVLTGDLIHAENPHFDQSIEIISDVLVLQKTYDPAIIYLCGNHEMPHIYGISLAKGHRVYTPDFEKALNDDNLRAEVISLFDSLPFYLRTRAGVTLTHAGASPATAVDEDALRLFNWSHQELLKGAGNFMSYEDIESLRWGYTQLISGTSYEAQSRYYLAVSGPDDPRYDDLLRGFIATTNYPYFNRLLWPALFTRCEKQYGAADYNIFLDALLKEISKDYTPQHLLVAGHITLEGGHTVIAKRHLRLASARHASPREAGQYLCFDTAQPIQRIEQLVQGLGSVFD